MCEFRAAADGCSNLCQEHCDHEHKHYTARCVLLLFIRKPLRCEGRPVEGGTKHHIVQERCIFLPGLVFFVDDLLCHLILILVLCLD